MRRSILLSGQRDPDLVALYKKVGSVAFCQMTKDALRAVVRNGYADKRPQGIVLHGCGEEETVRFNLVLTAQADEDVRELLSHVQQGKISMFVRQALRFYLGPVSILSGLLDEEMSGKLQENPMPIQVFAIGDVSKEKPKRTVKKKKQAVSKPRKQTAQKEEPVAVAKAQQPASFGEMSSAPSFGIASSVPSFTPSFEQPPSTSTQADTGAPVSEEDEMLAMLEGLLG